MDVRLTENAPHPIDAQLRDVFARFPHVVQVLVFGSVAAGTQRPDSDLDIAVNAGQPLTVDDETAIIGALAEATGRPIDLIDLCTVGEPLLGQILKHGRRILGSNTLHAELIIKHLVEQADFMPYQARILAERRRAWIGK